MNWKQLRCSTCKGWKRDQEFPTSSAPTASRGRHHQCRACRKEELRKRPAVNVKRAGAERLTAPRTELEQWAISQPCVTRCAWCDWTHEGAVRDGTKALVRHRNRAHPEHQPKRIARRLAKRQFVVSTRTLDDNIAGVRAQGGAAWDVDAT